ncbi:hypothetical protein V5799_016835 [Amblyomma americanum]|uniref:Peritrophic membrane chitin binding protein n=1 Tax=Amblyomma americanum TaxID=6943 RepID=A0AAQ4F4K2_AMBAM
MNDRLVYRKLKPGSLVPYRRLWSATVLDQVVEGKAVIVGDRTTLVYQAAKRCRRYPHHEFYIGRERLFSHPLVVYYNRDNVRLLMKAWERREKESMGRLHTIQFMVVNVSLKKPESLDASDLPGGPAGKLYLADTIAPPGYTWSSLDDVSAYTPRRSRLTEAGVVLKWHAETVSSGGDFSRCPRVDVGERDNLDFDNLRSVFLLLLAGHGLATAVLLAEAVLATLVRCCGANAPRNGTTVQHRHHARHRKGARTTKRRPNAFLAVYTGQDILLLESCQRKITAPRHRQLKAPSETISKGTSTISSSSSSRVGLVRTPFGRGSADFIQVMRRAACCLLVVLYGHCVFDVVRSAECHPSTCRLEDNCLCVDNRPPGNLRAADTPQFVMITFDDAVNEQNMDFYRELLAPGRRRNRANGCNVAATFFVSAGYTDYSFVHELHSAGNEMSLHSITLDYLPLYPYTLDFGLQDICENIICPSGAYKGLWMVPLNMFVRETPSGDDSGGESSCVMPDTCSPKPSTASDMFDFLRSNFERYYKTNRAPFPVFIHQNWLWDPERKRGFLSFVDWLLTKKDVFLVTVEEVVQFMKDPKPLGKYSQKKCSRATRFQKCPKIYSCQFPESPIEETKELVGCKPCPKKYPWIEDFTVNKPGNRAGPANPASQSYGAVFLVLLCPSLVFCLCVATKLSSHLFHGTRWKASHIS